MARRHHRLTLYNSAVIAEIVRTGVHALRAGRPRLLGAGHDVVADDDQCPAATGHHLDAAVLISQNGGGAQGHRDRLQITFVEMVRQAQSVGSSYATTFRR